MAREYFINGPALVQVKGRPGSAIASLSELGYTSDPIRVMPLFFRQAVRADDYGSQPAEYLSMLGQANIRMTLVHFDRDTLNAIIRESLAGSDPVGYMPPAGKTYGRGAAVQAGNNSYFSLNISSPVAAIPWKFPACMLEDNLPMEFPLGTDRSLVMLNFLAVPYSPITSIGDVVSSGAILFNYTPDT